MLIIGAVGVFASCYVEENVETVPTIRFQGQTYIPIGAGEHAITDTDLSAIGDAEYVFPSIATADGTVYGLHGLSHERLVVMRAASTGTAGDVLIFVSEGTLTGSGPNQLFEVLPQLCRYYPTTPPGCPSPP